MRTVYRTEAASATYKQVIPDLGTLGYEWNDIDGHSYLEYDQEVIDIITQPESASNQITIRHAYNQILDDNPQKVPLRDILLSYWSGKNAKAVADLECLMYEFVVEQNLLEMLPEIYRLMGRNMADDMRNEGVFTVHAGAHGNEEAAYYKLLNGCPFAQGAAKMLIEYEGFAGRNLGDFVFVWVGGNLNFGIYFTK